MVIKSKAGETKRKRGEERDEIEEKERKWARRKIDEEKERRKRYGEKQK